MPIWKKIIGNINRVNWYIVLAVSAVLFLVMVVCPLLLIGKYDFASCDDFSYGRDTYRTFLETKSIFPAFNSALETVKRTYENWQGTYSAILLMALNPAVWGDEVYHITPYIMILMLVLSEMFLGIMVFREMCKADWPTVITICAITIGCQILWVPYPVETFFWYNGSSYYTLFYSVMIFYLVYTVRKIMLGSVKSALSSMPLLLTGAVFIGGVTTLRDC